MRAFSALLIWQLHHRLRAASMLIVPVILGMLLPSVGALLLLPLLAMTGVVIRGASTEFVYPVSARLVALSRLLSTTLLGVLPLLLVSAVTALRQPSGARPMIATDVLLALGTTAALVPELLAVARPSRLPMARWGLSLMVLLVLIGQVAVPRELVRTSAMGLLLATLAGVAYLLARPSQLLLALGASHREELRVVDAERVNARSAMPSSSVGVGLGWRDVIPLLFAGFGAPWLGFLIPSLMLVFLPISSQLMALGMLSNAVAMPATGTWWLDAYPISSRFKLALLSLIPVALTVAMGMGQAIPTRFSSTLSLGAPQSSVDGRTFFGDPTRVPLTYWVRSHSSALRIAAPWGESMDAYTVTVGPWRFFNPFSVHPNSSARFAKWQHDRMTAVVYGRVVSRASLRAGRAPLRRTQSWSMLVMQGALFLSWALFLVSNVLVKRGSSRWSGVWSAWPSFVPLGAWCWELSRGFDQGSVVLPLLQRALLSLESLLPTRSLVIPLAMVPVALSLWLLHRRLSRREAGTVMAYAVQLHQALRGAA